MRQKNNSEIPFRNTLCLIKIHTLVEIPSWPGRWELPIGPTHTDWFLEALFTTILEFEISGLNVSVLLMPL